MLGSIFFSALIIFLYRKLMTAAYQIAESSKQSVSREISSLVGNIQGLLYLQNKIAIASPLPITGGWAASADFLAFLDSEIRRLKPKLILELGCGVSTVICAQALKAIGNGRVISIDHSAEFAEKTSTFLKANGLAGNSEVRVCSLKDLRLGEKNFQWYDTSLLAFDDLIDILIVDGPPQVGLHSTRYPALPVLNDYLAQNCTILVDDGHRKTETDMVETWCKKFNMRSDYNYFEKGLFIVKKN